MNTAVARISAVGLVVLVVQELLMSRIQVFGVSPDLLLGFALVVAAIGGAERGAIAGLVAGVVADSLTATPLGPATLTYTVVAFAVGTLSDDTTDYSWVVAFTTWVGSIVAIFGFVLTSSLLGDFSTSVGRMVWVALVIASVNALLAPLAARALRNTWSRRSEFAW